MGVSSMCHCSSPRAAVQEVYVVRFSRFMRSNLKCHRVFIRLLLQALSVLSYSNNPITRILNSLVSRGSGAGIIIFGCMAREAAGGCHFPKADEI